MVSPPSLHGHGAHSMYIEIYWCTYMVMEERGKQPAPVSSKFKAADVVHAAPNTPVASGGSGALPQTEPPSRPRGKFRFPP